MHGVLTCNYNGYLWEGHFYLYVLGPGSQCCPNNDLYSVTFYQDSLKIF